MKTKWVKQDLMSVREMMRNRINEMRFKYRGPNT